MPDKQELLNLTRREFLRIASLASLGLLLPKAATAASERPERPTTERIYPIEQDSVITHLVENVTPDKLTIPSQTGWSRKEFEIPFRIGSLYDGSRDELFADRPVNLCIDETTGQKWNLQEAINLTRAFTRARILAADFYNYPGPGLGFVRRIGGLAIFPEDNYTGGPSSGIKRPSIRPMAASDICVIPHNMASNLNSYLFGETARQMAINLNQFVDFEVDNSNLNQILVTGIASHLDSIASESWRFMGPEEKDKETLEREFFGPSNPFNLENGLHVTLAGMTIREADNQWVQIWGFLNGKATDQIIKEVGPGRMLEMRLSGERPKIKLENLLALGDEYTSGHDFSDWFQEQKIFSAPSSSPHKNKLTK